MNKQSGLPTHSETTGSQSRELKPQSSTGLQHGETGSGEMQTIASGKASAKEIHRMRASLVDLLAQPLSTSEQLKTVETLTKSLSKLSPPSWVQGRVVTTLSLYYIGQMPDAVVEMISDDYVRELEGYPAWAIMAACRWWTSKDNKDRKRKPLPGDLSERANFEAGVLRMAKLRMERIARDGFDTIPEPEPKREPLTEEQREARREQVAKLLAPIHKQRDIDRAALQSDEDFRKQQQAVLRETQEALSREARSKNFSEGNTSDQEEPKPDGQTQGET